MKLKNDPRLPEGWPPPGWGTSGAPSHGRFARPAPPADVGALVEVTCYDPLSSGQIAVVKDYEGLPFRAQIVVEDEGFGRALCEMLRGLIGLTVAEIGEKEPDF